MKVILCLGFFFITTNVFSGVGGSAGGDEKVNNPENLEYYLGYSSFIYSLPSVEFKIENAENIFLPINKTCIRNNDQIESIEEVEVTKLHSDKSPAEKIKEIVRRERRYLKNISIFNHSKKEVTIPRNYKIKIMQSGNHANTLLKIIDYSINDCE